MSFTVPDAQLQATLAMRPIKGSCSNCKYLHYPLTKYDFDHDVAWNERERRASIGQVKLDGFEELASQAGFVKRCSACEKPTFPFKWIADIDPAKFAQYMAEHDWAFPLEDLRVLLDSEPKKHSGGGFEFL
jgi:hypothetical protein